MVRLFGDEVRVVPSDPCQRSIERGKIRRAAWQTDLEHSHAAQRVGECLPEGGRASNGRRHRKVHAVRREINWSGGDPNDAEDKGFRCQLAVVGWRERHANRIAETKMEVLGVRETDG